MNERAMRFLAHKRSICASGTKSSAEVPKPVIRCSAVTGFVHLTSG